MHDICHVEIPSTDFAKSKDFYEKLFGWKVNIEEEMNYAIWEAPEGPGGGFNPVKEPCMCEEGCCLVYIMVESVDAKAGEIEAAGGTIIKPKTPVADYGWFAIFQDTAGGVVAVWESAKKE
jgi:predicted enzyme related to lactoylglutathione lyase